jgi:APA family basic amino acid/polyamine antiporter
MFPRTGGEYVYMRESWGKFASFLCGWAHFLVVQTAGIAALAVGFST